MDAIAGKCSRAEKVLCLASRFLDSVSDATDRCDVKTSRRPRVEIGAHTRPYCSLLPGLEASASKTLERRSTTPPRPPPLGRAPSTGPGRLEGCALGRPTRAVSFCKGKALGPLRRPVAAVPLPNPRRCAAATRAGAPTPQLAPQLAPGGCPQRAEGDLATLTPRRARR